MDIVGKVINRAHLPRLLGRGIGVGIGHVVVKGRAERGAIANDVQFAVRLTWVCAIVPSVR